MQKTEFALEQAIKGLASSILAAHQRFTGNPGDPVTQEFAWELLQSTCKDYHVNDFKKLPDNDGDTFEITVGGLTWNVSKPNDAEIQIALKPMDS